MQANLFAIAYLLFFRLAERRPDEQNQLCNNWNFALRNYILRMWEGSSEFVHAFALHRT